MPLNGLQKFSLIDYPGLICCVAFFGNCNFRCPFCHNPVLVFDPESQGGIGTGEFTEFLKKRRKCLDGVVFSGGEPTLHPELNVYASAAKSLGYAVKIDTNGSMPDVLKRLHENGLADTAGIDWKAPGRKYGEICGLRDQAVAGRVRQSIRYAVESGMNPDIRTTVHRALLSEADLREMYAELKSLGVSRWTLQQFHHAELIDETLNDKSTYSDAELRSIALSLGPDVAVRGTVR